MSENNRSRRAEASRAVLPTPYRMSPHQYHHLSELSRAPESLMWVFDVTLARFVRTCRLEIAAAALCFSGGRLCLP